MVKGQLVKPTNNDLNRILTENASHTKQNRKYAISASISFSQVSIREDRSEQGNDWFCKQTGLCHIPFPKRDNHLSGRRRLAINNTLFFITFFSVEDLEFCQLSIGDTCPARPERQITNTDPLTLPAKLRTKTLVLGWLLVVLGFNATLTAKIMSWRSVTHMCFLAFSHQY